MVFKRYFRGVCKHPGVYRVYLIKKTTQVQLKSGRVQAPAFGTWECICCASSHTPWCRGASWI